MHYPQEWPRLLLTLPNKIRIGLLALCTILCLGTHLLTYPESHNGSLLIIPGLLAAWMFKRRGLLVSAMIVVPVMAAYYSMRLKTIWWPIPFALFFWGGLLIAFSICSVIISIRTLLDSSDTARRDAEQAKQQIAAAFDQQVQLNQLKDQFLLNVSHELRTPLTVLGGSLELLKEYYEHLDPIKRDDILTMAIGNHEELVGLVNRVLDAMTVGEEFSSAQPEVISVHQAVQEVLAHLDPRETEAYTFHVDIPEEVMVWADPQYLRQVLRNLLDNAFKYVPKAVPLVQTRWLSDKPDVARLESFTSGDEGHDFSGSSSPQSVRNCNKHTEIRIETVQSAPSSPVCLMVQDAGPGIPPEEIPLLFEKFVRLKRDLAGPTRGTGLGLYLCKQLVEAMGGSIWVESSGRIGEGSRFCFTLPASPLQ